MRSRAVKVNRMATVEVSVAEVEAEDQVRQSRFLMSRGQTSLLDLLIVWICFSH